MSKKNAIGIDLGGTNLRIGAVNSDGNILCKNLSPIQADRSVDGIINQINSQVKAILEKESGVCGIGIGMPGIIDSKTGVIYESPQYPSWVKAPFLEKLEKKLKLPVVLDNDANMIALGEHWLGAGHGLKNFLMVTLGTGIGGGWIINDKIFRGDRGFAGEIGHMIIEFDGPSCNCPSHGHGCWEAFACASGLRRMIQGWDDVPEKREFLKAIDLDINKISPEHLFEFAKEGNIFAHQVWQLFGRYLGVGLASLINVSGIDTVVIGGGVVRAWDFFIEPAMAEIKKSTYNDVSSKITIHKTKLLDDAGILGAAKTVFDNC